MLGVEDLLRPAAFIVRMVLDGVNQEAAGYAKNECGAVHVYWRDLLSPSWECWSCHASSSYLPLAMSFDIFVISAIASSSPRSTTVVIVG